jgi:hypothetical protein
MTIMEHFIMLHSLYQKSGQPLSPQNKANIQKPITNLQCKSENRYMGILFCLSQNRLVLEIYNKNPLLSTNQFNIFAIWTSEKIQSR